MSLFLPGEATTTIVHKTALYFENTPSEGLYLVQRNKTAVMAGRYTFNTIHVKQTLNAASLVDMFGCLACAGYLSLT